MIGIEQLKSNIVKYLISQIDYIADRKPIIALLRPVIIPIIQNNTSKADDFLKHLRDKDGNIDIDTIIDGIIENIKTMNPFSQNLGKAGEVIIGEGKIKYIPPFISDDIVLNQEDLDTLKKILTSKN